MLQSVVFRKRMDPTMITILQFVSEKRGLKIIEPEPGIYICGHWNFKDICETKLDDMFEGFYPGNIHEDVDDIDPYGVCDRYQQVLDKWPEIVCSDDKFCISLVPIKRTAQPAQGGWRWHKWGSYIGTQKPRNEYIYDDKHIDLVFTYHVYKIVQPEQR